MFLAAHAVSSPHADFVGRAGGWREGAGVAIFAPVNSYVFGQALGGYFLDHWVGSVGAGYRRGGWGINAFVDGALSDHNNWYIQGSVGAEYLGSRWEFRANGYLTPQNERTIRRAQKEEDYLVGLEMYQRIYQERWIEQARSGFDVEAGIRCGKAWAYVGYYNFNPAQGPRVRVEYRGRRWRMGAGYEYDRIHGHRAFVELTLGRNCPPLVRRQEGPLVIRKKRTYAHDRCLNCQMIFVGGGGPLSAMEVGTRKNPTTLEHAEAISKPGDYLVLMGEIVATHTFRFKEGQTMTGNGAVIEKVGGGDILYVANNNMIEGLTLLGGADAIDGPKGVENLTLRNLYISGQSSNAIELDQVSNLTIEGVVIRDVGSTAIRIKGGSNIAIAHCTFEDIRSRAIDCTNVGGSFVVKESEFSDVRKQGVRLRQIESGLHVEISNNIFTDVKGDPIFIDLPSADEVEIIIGKNKMPAVDSVP